MEAQGAERPRVFFDITVRHLPGDAARLRAAARHDGVVNAEAESDKRTRYPEGNCPWKMVPVALETGGRLGKAALEHLKGLARSEVAKIGGEEVWASHNLLQRWGSRLSVALHKANARAVRRVAGHRNAAEEWRERCA